jgi:signal transduction histidine kinase
MHLVARGDLNSQINVATRDETGVLAQSFNKMIAELKVSRDSLEETNRDLDQKVKDRTRELEIQNRKVKEVQETLLRTTRLASAGEIAGRTAHELLNPLTSLLTRVGVINRKLRDELNSKLEVLGDIYRAWEIDFKEGGFNKLLQVWQQKSEVNPEWTLWQEDLSNATGIQQEMSATVTTLESDTVFIQNEGGRIDRIINGMRKLSSIRSDIQEHSVHNILEDCSHIMADLFSQSNYEIRKEFDANADSVRLDRDEFIQAITNLMRNSLQALKSAQARCAECSFKGYLRIVTQIVDGNILIDVEDNGIGITKKNQSRIFDTHFTTKGPQEGTGLGLGISRRFIRGFGGDLELLRSDERKQTIFRLRLPVINEGNEGAVA